MSISRLLNLKQTVTLTFANFTHANRNMEEFTEVFAQLLCKLLRALRHDVDVLSHPGLRYVRIHSGGPEHNRVVAPAQEFENGLVNRRQGQRFAHDKLLKCENASIEHRSDNTWVRYPVQQLMCVNMRKHVFDLLDCQGERLYACKRVISKLQ